MSISSLNRELLLQTLRGYEEVNRITEAERRAHLPKLTVQESLAIFASLYDAWYHTGRLAGGNLALLEQQQRNQLVQLRRTFARLATRQGKIHGKSIRRRVGSRRRRSC